MFMVSSQKQTCQSKWLLFCIVASLRCTTEPSVTNDQPSNTSNDTNNTDNNNGGSTTTVNGGNNGDNPTGGGTGNGGGGNGGGGGNPGNGNNLYQNIDQPVSLSVSSILVTWPASTSAQSYQVYAGETENNLTAVGTTTTRTFTIEDLPPAAKRYIAVEALGLAGGPIRSFAVVGRSKPQPIENITFTYLNGISLTVNWQDNGPIDSSTYHVQIRTDENFSEPNSWSSDKEKYLFSLTPSQLYYIRIYNKFNTFPESTNYAQTTIVSGVPAPSVPTYIKRNAEEIDLNWIASTNALEYGIFQAGSVDPIGVTSDTTYILNVIDSNMLYGTTYDYFIGARDVVGDANRWSYNAFPSTPIKRPLPPVRIGSVNPLSASTSNDPNTMRLQVFFDTLDAIWQDVPLSEKKYLDVYYQKEGETTEYYNGAVLLTNSSATINNLEPYTLYTIRLVPRSNTNSIPDAISQGIPATTSNYTTIAAAQLPQATTTLFDRVELTWQESPRATHYHVWRSTNGGATFPNAPWTRLTDPNGTAELSYVDATIPLVDSPVSANHFYKIVAHVGAVFTSAATATLTGVAQQLGPLNLLETIQRQGNDISFIWEPADDSGSGGTNIEDYNDFATGFCIQRAIKLTGQQPAANEFSDIACLNDIQSWSYTDTNQPIQPGSRYWYRVFGLGPLERRSMSGGQMSVE